MTEKKKKILILSLGTGNGKDLANTAEGIAKQFVENEAFPYNTARYAFFDKKSNQNDPMPFVGKKLITEIQPDCIVWIGTVKSMWDAVYAFFAKEKKLDKEKLTELIKKTRFDPTLCYETKDEDIEFINFQKYIEDTFQQDTTIFDDCVTKCKIILLTYGNKNATKNNYEQMQHLKDCFEESSNFEHVVNEVYFDITHSFRYMPLYNLVVLDYLRAIGDYDIRLKEVYYGNIEILNEIKGREIEKKLQESGYTKEKVSAEKCKEIKEKRDKKATESIHALVSKIKKFEDHIPTSNDPSFAKMLLDKLDELKLTEEIGKTINSVDYTKEYVSDEDLKKIKQDISENTSAKIQELGDVTRIMELARGVQTFKDTGSVNTLLEILTTMKNEEQSQLSKIIKDNKYNLEKLETDKDFIAILHSLRNNIRLKMALEYFALATEFNNFHHITKVLTMLCPITCETCDEKQKNEFINKIEQYFGIENISALKIDEVKAKAKKVSEDKAKAKKFICIVRILQALKEVRFVNLKFEAKDKLLLKYFAEAIDEKEIQKIHDASSADCKKDLEEISKYTDDKDDTKLLDSLTNLTINFPKNEVIESLPLTQAIDMLQNMLKRTLNINTIHAYDLQQLDCEAIASIRYNIAMWYYKRKKYGVALATMLEANRSFFVRWYLAEEIRRCNNDKERVYKITEDSRKKKNDKNERNNPNYIENTEQNRTNSVNVLKDKKGKAEELNLEKLGSALEKLSKKSEGDLENICEEFLKQFGALIAKMVELRNIFAHNLGYEPKNKNHDEEENSAVTENVTSSDLQAVETFIKCMEFLMANPSVSSDRAKILNILQEKYKGQRDNWKKELKEKIEKNGNQKRN